MDVIDEYERQYGDRLESEQLDFIVNNETHASYLEALNEVKE